MTGRSPSLAQLGLCSSDLPSTVRLFTEAFGFADAGAHIFWGRYLAEIQRLGNDATCITWWMVGRQARLQLELFQHSVPAQRPLKPDWRASDLGWVRWGVAVPNLDDVLERLGRFDVQPTTGEAVWQDGLRRYCIRDPGTRTFIELMEEGTALPGGVRPRDNTLMPAVVYAAVSVYDMESALEFYVGVLGLEPTDVELHAPGAEVLWGLGGAERTTRVLSAGDAFVELVEYSRPAPRRIERLASDQGFMNAGFLAADRAQFDRIIGSASVAGIEPNIEPPDRPNTEAYLVNSDGTLSELMLVPREFEGEYGFAARPRFPPPRPWPEPRVSSTGGRLG